MHKMRTRVLTLIRLACASPWIALGLLGGLWAMAFGNRGKWKRGVFVVQVNGRFGRRMSAAGWGGFTFGLTIFLWSWQNPSVEVHERVHVRQFLRWGFLYPFLYVASLALHGYCRNVFEREAYAETDEWLELRG